MILESHIRHQVINLEALGWYRTVGFLAGGLYLGGGGGGGIYGTLKAGELGLSITIGGGGSFFFHNLTGFLTADFPEPLNL
jgi:hypothetical protein